MLIQPSANVRSNIKYKIIIENDIVYINKINDHQRFTIHNKDINEYRLIEIHIYIVTKL